MANVRISWSLSEVAIWMISPETKFCAMFCIARPNTTAKIAPAVKLSLEECLEYLNNDEYVELTKLFGAEEGHKYVNGVLDKMAKKVRPAEVERVG